MTKPKTLEELGWELASNINDMYVSYERRKGSQRIVFWVDMNNIRFISHDLSQAFMLDLKPEELLAITEKMKELGMTS